MLLIEGRLGTPGYVVVHETTFRETVDVGRPITRAKALLRGFDVGYRDGDHQLKHLDVVLDVGYGDDPSRVEVSARVQLSDKSPAGELIHAVVEYTLIVE